MATKEDILEQIVEDYFATKGYFVQHNVKFRPDPNHNDWVSNQDSNHSDIDVLAINPRDPSPAGVVAVSCKSWQAGFNVARELDAIENDKVLSGRTRWKFFRELCKEKWSEAFIAAIVQLTGRSTFTHITAVTKVIGDRSKWSTHARFVKAMQGNPIEILTFEDMMNDLQQRKTTTLAATEVGRLLQIIHASGFELERKSHA